MNKKSVSIVRLILIGIICLSILYSINLQQKIVANYSENEEAASALTVNSQKYFHVLNAENFTLNQKLGYIRSSEGSIGPFEHKESVYTIANFSEHEFLAVKNSAIMEEIIMLYVSENVESIPVHFYEELPNEWNSKCVYDGKPYFLYLQEQEEILKNTRKIFEEEEIEVYQLTTISSEEWILLKNKQSNEIYSYGREKEYLSGVPVSIYKFERNWLVENGNRF